nr:hypothetical protein [Salinicola peritrichatus]
MKRPQNAREAATRHVLGDTEPDPAAQRLGAQARHRLVMQVQNATGVAQQAFSLRREQRPPGTPCKKLAAQPLLESLDLVRHRRLRQCQAIRCPRNAAMIGNGAQCLQRSDFQSHAHPGLDMTNIDLMNEIINLSHFSA